MLNRNDRSERLGTDKKSGFLTYISLMSPKVVLGREEEIAFIAGKMPFQLLVGQQLVDVWILHVAFGTDEGLDRMFHVGVVAPCANYVDTHDAA